jgi:hypothetical protein
VGFLVTVAVLVVAPPSGGAAGRLGEARAAIVAVETTRGLDVIENPFEMLKQGWVAEKYLAFFRDADRRYQEGRQKLARVDLQGAEEAFRRAEEIYKEHLDQTGVRTVCAEVAKWRGVALYELKRRDAALGEFGVAKWLDPSVELTEAMVRPEVARAFAAAGLAMWIPPDDLTGTQPVKVERTMDELGVDVVIEAAISIDHGVLTYAASRRETSCMTDVVVDTRAEQLLRRLDAIPCRAGAEVYVEDAPVIAHPEPVASGVKSGRAKTAPNDRRVPLWRKPWLWVGVVGAVGVGVVLAVSLWPRDASYSTVVDFHQFGLGAR